MASQSPSDVLSLALAVAGHPDARVLAVGPAPASERSLLGLFDLMNNKVKFIVGGAAALAAALAMQAGMGSLTSPSTAPTGNPSISQPEGPGSAANSLALAAANRSAALIMAMKEGLRPAAAGLAASPAAPPAAAPATAPATALPSTPSAKQAPTVPTTAQVTPRVPDHDALARALPNRGEGMDSYSIARALVKVDLFAAFAVAVEDFKPKPYYDSGGLNVGFGYCISKRKAEYGDARIRSDLTAAGFEPRQVESLLKDKKSEVAKIKVSPFQALRLLEITKPDYESIASGAVGHKKFAALPDNMRAMLTHLAYNTGKVYQFRDLLNAVHKGDARQTVLNANVKWRGLDGVVNDNTRLNAWFGALISGVPTFERALKNPMAFEGHMANPDGVKTLAHLAESTQRLAASPPDMAQSLARVTQKLLNNKTWAADAYRDTVYHLASKPAPS